MNLFCSSSLAEELLQKVKRLFGDPHQATEDLKAEVTLTFPDSFLCLDCYERLRSLGVCLLALEDNKEAVRP